MLVGQDRIELVGRLLAAYDATVSERTPRLWLLSAPSGWGKTRLVQELYVRLAAERQRDPVYWPPAIVDPDRGPVSAARKRIVPSLPEAAPGRTQLAYMWWGVECFRLDDGTPGRALQEGADQIHIHAEALISTERSVSGAAGDAFDAASATIGLLALFVGVLAAPVVAAPLAVVGGAREALSLSRRLRALVRRREQRGDRAGEVAARYAEGLAAGLAEQIQRLAAALPIVLVLDDAHEADATTIEVLDRLLAMADLPLLVIALGWPGELDPASGAPLATWLAAGHDRVTRVELNPLTDRELGQVVSEAAPGTSPEVVAAFAQRYDNPLALRAALALPRVQRHATAGAIAIDPAAVATLPASVDGVFNETWEALPEGVRTALALAAPFGPRYVPGLVTAAAAEVEVAVGRGDFDLAVSPHRWTRRVDRSLDTFIDHVFHRVASGRLGELLGEDEVARLRAAHWRLAADPSATRQLSRRSGIELARSRVAATQAGELPADGDAVSAALGLGTDLSLDGDIARAEEMFGLAEGWASTPAERLRVTRGRAWLRGLQGDQRGSIELLAEALNTTELPSTDPAVLGAGNDMAFSLGQIGERAAAVQLFDQLLPRVRETLGDDDGLTLTVERNRAHQLGLAGRVAEARQMSEQLIERLTQLYGPRSDVVLIERSYLATWTQELDGPAAAVPLLEALVPELIEELGPVIGPTKTARWNLGSALLRCERTAEGEAVLRDLVADLDAELPPRSTDEDSARGWLAYLAFQAGRLAESEALQRRALERLSAPLDAPDGLKMRGDLAFAIWNQSRVDEARVLYEALLPDARRVLGERAPLTVQVVSNLAALGGSK